MITYSRGQITVLDRPRLEQLSCECYEVVRKETNRLLPLHPPHLRRDRPLTDGLKSANLPMARDELKAIETGPQCRERLT